MHPLVNAVRLDNLIARLQKRASRLAEKLEDVELTRQLAERERMRLRNPLVVVSEELTPVVARFQDSGGEGRGVPAPPVAARNSAEPSTAGNSRTRNGRRGPVAKDETGKRYGRLVVIERAPSLGPKASWRCGCDCGAEAIVSGVDLRLRGVDACPKCRSSRKRAVYSCSACGGEGHTARSAQCPKRQPSPPKASASPAGPKKFTCYVCAGLPHRVQGVRCRGCGLERAEEQVDISQFSGSGDSSLARAI